MKMDGPEKALVEWKLFCENGRSLAKFTTVHFHFPRTVCWYNCNRPLSQKTVHFHQDCRSSIFGKLKLSFRENFVLLPDQIQFLNPIMVLILIPTFNYILYPLFAKAGFQHRAISLVHFRCSDWLKTL